MLNDLNLLAFMSFENLVNFNYYFILLFTLWKRTPAKLLCSMK